MGEHHHGCVQHKMTHLAGVGAHVTCNSPVDVNFHELSEGKPMGRKEGQYFPFEKR